MTFDGSSIQGYERIKESDMVLFPHPETARILPFPVGPSRTIAMFAEVRNPKTGDVYKDDTRHILKRNLEAMVKEGFSHMNIGPEAEFFYFQREGSTELTDHASYFSGDDAGAPIRVLTVMALEAMRLKVEYHHHEVAPSQHEIDLKYDKALEMADTLQIYKLIVKDVARRCGVHATFMPKPLADENGSGMHVHLSLFKGDKNAFYEREGPYNLSKTAQSFMEGVLQHAPGIVLVTNPQYNSYKRLAPGFEAPVYLAWAWRNRSALIRIPDNKQGNEQATRFEARFPDPTANPYLTFAVLLRAGLDGVKRGTTLRQETKEDLYKLDAADRERRGIPSLPHDLYAAIQEAKKSPILDAALGETLKKKLIDLKLREVDAYRLAVTPLELANGLKL